MNARIKAITDADIPLCDASRDVFQYLKTQNHTYVSPKQLKSSRGILISEGFARCQGVGFLDKRYRIGALAHNHPSYNPFYFLTGEWSMYGKDLEDPRKIFRDRDSVVAVHVYHEEMYEFPESWIERALDRVGVKRVVHIPIKSKKPGMTFWRHIAQDVKSDSLYVFPTDFDYGICFNLGGL